MSEEDSRRSEKVAGGGGGRKWEEDSETILISATGQSGVYNERLCRDVSANHQLPGSRFVTRAPTMGVSSVWHVFLGFLFVSITNS